MWLCIPVFSFQSFILFFRFTSLDYPSIYKLVLSHEVGQTYCSGIWVIWVPSNSGTSLASLVFVSNGLSVVFLVPDLVLLLWYPFQFQDLPLKFRTGFSFFVFYQACHVSADRATFSASSFLEKVSSPSKMPTKFCSIYSPILAVS